MAIGASRIFHVNSNCTDIERALGFYRDLLGFTASAQPTPPGPQPGHAFGLEEVEWDGFILQGDLGYGGLSLDLLEWTVPATGGRPPASPFEAGFHRLVIRVPDLASIVDRLRADGATVISHLTGPQPRALVEDPDGVPVELVAGDDLRIERVVVNCRDLDASLTYYRDVMGLTVTAGPHAIDGLGALFGLDEAVVATGARCADPGSVFEVELVHYDVPSMTGPIERQAHHRGLFRMAWSTDDCARDEAAIRAAGSRPFAPTGELSVGDHLPLLLVLFWPGPDGECLELIEVTAAR